MKINCRNCDKPTEGVDYCSRKCWSEHGLSALFDRAGLTQGIYADYTFENLKFISDEEKILEKKIKEYLQNTIDKGLFIYGSVGVGKTHLAFAVVRRVIDILGSEAKVFSVPRMIADYKESNFDNRNIIKAEIIPIAVFDDLGSEYISEMSRELITRIIDQRLIYNRLTFITSNLNPEMIGKLIDVRLISRIKALTYSIEITGEDKRNK